MCLSELSSAQRKVDIFSGSGFLFTDSNGMINSICQRNFALVCRNDKHILKFKSLYAMNGCNIDGDARGNVWNLTIIL